MKKKTTLELHRTDAAQYALTPKLPLTVVLDNIRSEQNIGNIFRTADAFTIERILLCGICATPPAVEIHKTALGAEQAVAWEYFPTTGEAVSHLLDEGYQVLAVEQVHGSVALNAFRPEARTKYAIVLGNEVKGVDQSVVDRCHACLEIPQRGTKHSLNVANTASIVMWHFFAAE